MIHDPERLNEVIEEIADWPTKQQRVDYIKKMGEEFGPEAAQQIRGGLKLWAERKR